MCVALESWESPGEPTQRTSAPPESVYCKRISGFATADGSHALSHLIISLFTLGNPVMSLDLNSYAASFTNYFVRAAAFALFAISSTAHATLYWDADSNLGGNG